MKTVVLLGAGKIGRMVAYFLGPHGGGDYSLRIGDSSPEALETIREVAGESIDRTQTLAFDDGTALDGLMSGADAVISCAPFHCNPTIAEHAAKNGLHYLDLTEDVKVTDQVASIASRPDCKTAFVPQCGLAPGFITIVARHLLEPMTEVRDLRLRVGALPRYPNNMLKYNLTWSTAGLINEYCQPCEVVLDHEVKTVQPLENLEEIVIDGVPYEAFNTSGGLGSLGDSLKGSVRNVNYKSLRYPGHNHLMRFLIRDLHMGDNQEMLAEIFEQSLPATFRDQIVIFVSAIGNFRGRLTENVYAKTIYHQEIDGKNWSGIQITTAAGVCAVLDLLFAGKTPQTGFIRMEDVHFTDFIANRYGRYYDQ
ncbi:MAG: saccharopine dehydrogenase NADP-binding domain-containing protein [Planctomycetes bacterium]|nr:saccharopine dehydrogenase NADP-binding domain-containing protein [Planctomycetota bacterium]